MMSWLSNSAVDARVPDVDFMIDSYSQCKDDFGSKT